MGEFIVGVDIGGTKILTGIMDRDGQILIRKKEATCSIGQPEKVLEQTSRMVKQMMAEMGIQDKDVLGTGAGVPGPLDYHRGIVEGSPNLCWSAYPVRELLSESLGTKLLLEKDANVAALGELHYGLNDGCPNFIYITVSTGIGGGIIAEGKLLHGQNGGGGELGHMVLEVGGPRCGCGRQGCLEALASGTALARQAQQLIHQGRGQKMLGLCAPDNPVTAREIAMAARQGDEEANALIHQAGAYLGMAIANLVNILNPQRVVIGGGVGLGIQDFLLPQIRQYVYAHVFSLHRRQLQIEATQLGEDIVLKGCAAMVIKNLRLEGNVHHDR